MHTVRKSDLIAITLLMACLGAVASPAYAADWEWTLVPYVWASDIGMDVSINDRSLIGVDIGFDDVLDKTDFAAQIHFEGHRGKGGFLLDLTYLDLGASQTTPARPPLPGGTQINSDIRTTLFEAGGFYRPSGGNRGLDILLGVRVIDFDMTLDIALPSPLTGTTQVNMSETLADGFVGLRYLAPLAENWSFTVRGDVGSGDSDLSWNASAFVGYHVGKKKQNLILFGYRHLALEFKGTSSLGLRVETDLTMSGPATGFAFRF